MNFNPTIGIPVYHNSEQSKLIEDTYKGMIGDAYGEVNLTVVWLGGNITWYYYLHEDLEAERLIRFLMATISFMSGFYNKSSNKNGAAFFFLIEDSDLEKVYRIGSLSIESIVAIFRLFMDDERQEEALDMLLKELENEGDDYETD